MFNFVRGPIVSHEPQGPVSVTVVTAASPPAEDAEGDTPSPSASPATLVVDVDVREHQVHVLGKYAPTTVLVRSGDTAASLAYDLGHPGEWERLVAENVDELGATHALYSYDGIMDNSRLPKSAADDVALLHAAYRIVPGMELRIPREWRPQPEKVAEPAPKPVALVRM